MRGLLDHLGMNGERERERDCLSPFGGGRHGYDTACEIGGLFIYFLFFIFGVCFV